MDALTATARRLPPYLYFPEVLTGKRVLEVGCGEGAGAHFIAQNGAAWVLGVDLSPTSVALAQKQWRRANLAFRESDYARLDLEDGSVDVVCIPDGEELIRWLGFLEEVRRVLAPGGHVLVGALSADRPDSRRGASYAELVERLEPLFGYVRMVGVTPFIGVSLVEFARDGAGDAISELELDASLVTSEPDIIEYVALAGPVSGPPRGFMVVRLPGSQVDDLAVPDRPEKTVHESGELRAKLAHYEEEVGGLRTDKRELEKKLSTLEEKLRKIIEDQRKAPPEPRALDFDAAALHRREMTERLVELSERDAYIEELRGEVNRLNDRLAGHSARAAQAEQVLEARSAELNESRSHAAIAEGERMRFAAQAEASIARIKELDAMLADKTASMDKATLRWKAAEAKSDELWRKIGEMQRDAEAGREQAVENARAQRQAAQVALTRAMEEASKKLVSVKDEVRRSERERQELEKTVDALKRERTGMQLGHERELVIRRNLLARLGQLEGVVDGLGEELRIGEQHLGALEARLGRAAANGSSFPSQPEDQHE